MGGDDFQKREPDLGLRNAIRKAKQDVPASADERARKLFVEMRVSDEVTSAIREGKGEVTIPFPDDPGKIFTDSKYLGEIPWSHIIKRFMTLVEAEGVQIKVHTKTKVGSGCCKAPKKMPDSWHREREHPLGKFCVPEGYPPPPGVYSHKAPHHYRAPEKHYSSISLKF